MFDLTGFVSFIIWMIGYFHFSYSFFFTVLFFICLHHLPVFFPTEGYLVRSISFHFLGAPRELGET